MADHENKDRKERRERREHDGPKTKRYNLTPAELQQQQLEKLFKKIDKPVFIPEPSREKSSKEPKEFVRNVPGSSAGAGSGDFHVYRAHRRREYARLKEMDERDEKDKEEYEYDLKIAQLKAEDEERTAKKRAKRQKRKQPIVKKQKVEQAPKAVKPPPASTIRMADHINTTPKTVAQEEAAEPIVESVKEPLSTETTDEAEPLTAETTADAEPIEQEDNVEGKIDIDSDSDEE
ncbi:hypothetical protein CLU79DRAFT_835149 [Phycomyces nitens]|nr:hypothetical protein CLU79DRAFT_835149 [Phycomyces nitens]